MSTQPRMLGESKRSFSASQKEKAVKQKWDVAGGGGPLKGRKVRKISTDVYPDPEPDDVVDSLPSTHSLTIAHRLQNARSAQAGPKQVQMLPDGTLVDEHGRVLEQQSPSSFRLLALNKTPPPLPRQQQQQQQQADETGSTSSPPPVPSFVDPSLERKDVGARKAVLVMSAPGPSSTPYSEQADRLRKLQAARDEFKMRKLEAEAALKRGEHLDVDPVLLAPARAQVKVDPQSLPVPDTEAWDKALLVTASYDDVREHETANPELWRLRFKSITNLVEHPVPVEGPNMTTSLGAQPLILTKNERKKRRTAARVAKEKLKQEQIALGLMQPPAPRVKLSNLMKVMGKEAVQDPTLLQKFVQKEVAERVGRHEERNQSRKLTAEQRRDKTIKKMVKAAEEDPLVSVFRINQLTDNQAIYKIKKNAVQLYLSGMLVSVESGINMVVVEGGKKPTRKYSRLLLHRLDYKTDPADGPNAVLVWQGYSGRKHLEDFRSVAFSDNEKARKYLSSCECDHYLDLILSGQEHQQTVDCSDLL